MSAETVFGSLNISQTLDKFLILMLLIHLHVASIVKSLSMTFDQATFHLPTYYLHLSINIYFSHSIIGSLVLNMYLHLGEEVLPGQG